MKEEEDEEEDNEEVEGGDEEMSEEEEEDKQNPVQEPPSHATHDTTLGGRSDLVDANACLDAVLQQAERSSTDSLSASEKDRSPRHSEKLSPASFKLQKQLSMSSSSSSPDRKKKWRDYESPEEHEQRKKTRHAGMNYLLNFREWRCCGLL